eukprot:scaffold166764_cov26-Prasinocladus_malaysianus.AAC.1
MDAMLTIETYKSISLQAPQTHARCRLGSPQPEATAAAKQWRWNTSHKNSAVRFHWNTSLSVMIIMLSNPKQCAVASETFQVPLVSKAA